MVLLLLGLTSAKSRPHVQLIRAELPSKGSSEPLSESLSKLSSHQIPHSLGTEGYTTAKGLYAYSFFVLNHYAFGGVRAQATVSVSALHFDHGVELACSAAARVPPRSWLRMRRFHAGGFAAADQSVVRVRIPYVSAYVFTFPGVYARWLRVPGRPEVFPGRDRHRVWPSQLICLPH